MGLKKSPNTCTACRARKVGCDGRRTPCRNCERLGLTCTFDLAAGGTVRRLRVQQACVACRNRKARCRGELPSCQRCLQGQLKCIYPTKSANDHPSAVALKSGHATTQLSSPTAAMATATLVEAREPSNDFRGLSPAVATSEQPQRVPDGPSTTHLLPSEALADRALDTFFTHLYHVPLFSFLHQASTMERYRSGMLDSTLILAITAVTSRFTDQGLATQELSDCYIDAAEAEVLRHLEQPSISRVQTLVLIVKYRAAACRFGSVFMLLGIAVRFATALRLNYEKHNSYFILRESCRRLLWSLYMLDTALAGGYQDFSLLPEEIIHIRLPCREADFTLNQPREVERLTEVRRDGQDLGHLALTVRVMRLRHQILQFTKRALSTLTHTPWEVENQQKKLDEYMDRLPSSFLFNSTNARLHAYSSTTLPAFATIHLVWYGAHFILYRLAMVGLKEALPQSALDKLSPSFVTYCQQRCVQNARAQAEVIDILLDLGPNFMLDIELAVSAYQSARILFYAYRMLPGVITTEEIRTFSGRFETFLQRLFPDCEAVRRIQKDFEELVYRGCGSQSPQPQSAGFSLESNDIAGGLEPPHVLSRHSVVGQMILADQREDPDNQQRPSSHTGDRTSDDMVSSRAAARNFSTAINEQQQDSLYRSLPESLGPTNDLAMGHSLDDVLLYPIEVDHLQFDMDTSISLQDYLLDPNGYNTFRTT